MASWLCAPCCVCEVGCRILSRPPTPPLGPVMYSRGNVGAGRTGATPGDPHPLSRGLCFLEAGLVSSARLRDVFSSEEIWRARRKQTANIQCLIYVSSCLSVFLHRVAFELVGESLVLTHPFTEIRGVCIFKGPLTSLIDVPSTLTYPTEF